MMTTMTDRLLDSAEAARVLNVSEVALRKWTREGRVPVTRLGRRVLFDPEALRSFIRDQTTLPGGQKAGGAA